MTKQIVVFGDLVENNGKTIRENNFAQKHKYPLGTIIEVDIEINTDFGGDSYVNLKGTSVLYVVSHNRDCDGTPLYGVSDIPVEHNCESFSQDALLYKYIATIHQHGYSEESLRDTGKFVQLHRDIREYLRG